MINSFWVGEGKKPKITNTHTRGSNWEMVGKNAQNHNSTDAQFTIDPEKTSVIWKHKTTGNQKVPNLKHQHLVIALFVFSGVHVFESGGI